ncbi:MAG: OB-fold domain-containing protein [Chloroflexi bacterium]|nr:OB-fold domain-containing protein [Chloroflexota bacterium]
MARGDQPLPRFPEPDTQAFWEATKNHELRYQTCDACDGIVFYPRRHCTHCLGKKLSWKTSKGEGTLYTFSVVRQTYHPAFRERVPYVIAWVDLDEGFRILTHVTGIDDPAEVSVGQRVVVEWRDYDEVSLPLFRPA